MIFQIEYVNWPNWLTITMVSYTYKVALCPDSNNRHGSSSKEQSCVREDLQPVITSHALAKKVSCNQIHQWHVHKYSCRYGIKNSFHNQGLRTVVIVTRSNSYSDCNSSWSGDCKEKCHDCSRQGLVTCLLMEPHPKIMSCSLQEWHFTFLITQCWYD